MDSYFMKKFLTGLTRQTESGLSAGLVGFLLTIFQKKMVKTNAPEVYAPLVCAQVAFGESIHNCPPIKTINVIY
jgi:hypothetical protein